MKVLTICGARPNFMKIDPILRAFDRRSGRFRSKLVHSGQHYDDAMSKIFFQELGIRQLERLSRRRLRQPRRADGHHGPRQRPKSCSSRIGPISSLRSATSTPRRWRRPWRRRTCRSRSLMSRPASASATGRCRRRSAASSPTRSAITSSRRARGTATRTCCGEGVAPEKIHFVGNVMIDTLLRCRDLAERSTVFADLKVKKRQYALVTLHRPSNVDHKPSLEKLASPP